MYISMYMYGLYMASRWNRFWDSGKILLACHKVQTPITNQTRVSIKIPHVGQCGMSGANHMHRFHTPTVDSRTSLIKLYRTRNTYIKK